MTKEKLKEIDKTIGSRVSEARLSMGWSRVDLAIQLGVTQQQASKYESGINRISAAKLLVISQLLKRPIAFFYDMETEELPSESRRMTIDLVKNFLAIDDVREQVAINNLVRIMANE